MKLLEDGKVASLVRQGFRLVLARGRSALGQELVGEDAEDPTAEAARVLERREAKPRFCHGFGHQVLGIGCVSR